MRRLYIPLKVVNFEDIKVDDKIKFKKEITTPYIVQARNERFIICTRPRKAGSCFYTVVDLEKGIRGTDNMVFSLGYETRKDCNKSLKHFEEDPNMKVSHRNNIPLDIDSVRHIRTN